MLLRELEPCLPAGSLGLTAGDLSRFEVAAPAAAAAPAGTSPFASI